MAIIENLGLGVSILIEGQNAEEYEDPNPQEDNQIGRYETQCADKYIQSVDGEHFAISCEVFYPQDWLWVHAGNALKFVIMIDGKRIATKLCVSSNAYRKGQWRSVVEGLQKFNEDEARGVLRKFQFKPILAVEDADDLRAEEDAKKADRLGIIQVYVYRQRVTGNQPVHHRERHLREEQFTLSERALKGKAVSHGMSCGDAVSIPNRDGGSLITSEGIDKYPIASFFFKYRSKDALQHELILPPSRSPSPEPDRFAFLWDNGRPADISAMDTESRPPLFVRRPVIKRGIGEVVDLTTDEYFQRPHKMARNDDLIDLTED